MKRTMSLTIASLLSILLLSLHFTDDLVRGISRADSVSIIASLILVVPLYGTLALAGRRSGLIIMLLGGIFATGMPVIHFRGTRIVDIASSSGGFFFIWTLIALGTTGIYTIMLAAQGLWSLRSGAKR